MHPPVLYVPDAFMITGQLGLQTNVLIRLPVDRFALTGNTGSRRFLHSAVLVGNLMLVFGGNEHHDAKGRHYKCYLNYFHAYDISKSSSHWRGTRASAMQAVSSSFPHSLRGRPSRSTQSRGERRPGLLVVYGHSDFSISLCTVPSHAIHSTYVLLQEVQ